MGKKLRFGENEELPNLYVSEELAKEIEDRMQELHDSIPFAPGFENSSASKKGEEVSWQEFQLKVLKKFGSGVQKQKVGSTIIWFLSKGGTTIKVASYDVNLGLGYFD